MVGRSYPPEFYSWMGDSGARSAMEKIAIETEEDYQSLIKLLESFQVEVIRPEVATHAHEVKNDYYNRYYNPPMTPRDYIGSYNNNVFIDSFLDDYDMIGHLYNEVRDATWPRSDKIRNVSDLEKLPSHIILELRNNFNLDEEIALNKSESLNSVARKSVRDRLTKHGIDTIAQNISDTVVFHANTAGVTRLGKDLYVPNQFTLPTELINSDYRINYYDGETHADSCFCAVVPGLILSIKNYQTYGDTFPGWEIVDLPGEHWAKVQPFMELKEKNQGKWWIPGEEKNDALTESINQWLDHWVGFVEETVFDVNMLVINEKNVIVNNYNKKVFNALAKYNVTPHICNFRHRYFWDGGLHCITADLDREGKMNDYFPNRNYKTKEFF